MLLGRGAARVHAVERGFGLLHLRLRNDPRVVVHERTDALRLFLREQVDLVTIDMGWTRQARVLPVASRILGQGAAGIVALIKPHYEAPRERLKFGVLPVHEIPGVLEVVRADVAKLGMRILAEVVSPIEGQGGNTEYLWHLAPAVTEPPNTESA